MKKIFCDQNKNVYLKISVDSQRAAREVAGAKAFSKYVNVPEIELVDSKTLIIKKIPGTKSTQVSLDYFLSLKPELNPKEFTIEEEIKDLIHFFGERKEVAKVLINLLGKTTSLAKFPVHGDLQKQNIIIKGNKLAFVDFEHFCFAPLELEFANSFFFNDKNCLNIQELFEKLEKQRRVNRKTAADMLLFYALKQIKHGRSIRDSKSRFEKGIAKLKINLNFPNFSKFQIPNLFLSSCFA